MLFGVNAAESGLTVQPYWVLVAIVQFLLLVYLLQRFLWGPVTKTLQARAERIREGLRIAEEAQAERQRIQAETERLLSEARHEATAIADRMTTAAEAAAAEVKSQARAEADRIREKGRVDAQALHDQALAQLRGELASMVVLAASRLLGREINAEQHRTFIEQSLNEAGAELKKS